MAQVANRAADATAHLQAFPRLKAFREKIAEAAFQYWVENSTDGKGGNSHLDVLLGEYERLDLDPMSCMVISSLRKNGDAQKQTLTITKAAKLVLCERDPQFGGIIEGEIVFSDDGKTPITATAFAIRRDSPERSKATVYFDECLQKNYDGKPKAVWGTRPRAMLMKCAVTAVLQLAFPTACAGAMTDTEIEPGYDEHNLPPLPVRLVDTTTGEVFEKATPKDAPTPQAALPAALPIATPVAQPAAKPAPQAVPQATRQSLGAGAHIAAPVIASPAPAAPNTQGSAAAKVPGGKAFELLARDVERKGLVAKIYDLMSLVAREVDDAQHRMTMRIVAVAAGPSYWDGMHVLPERWVDFPVDALKAYISSQEPPIEQAEPKAPAPVSTDAPRNGITKKQIATLENLVATKAITDANLATLVSKLTFGKAESYLDFTPAQAEQAAALIADWLEAKRAREKERAPRS